MKEKIVLFFLSFYLGLGTFFSFYVAPTLFKILERKQAGVVVEKIFPVYFGIGIFLVLTSLIVGKNLGKTFLILGVLNLIILLLEEFYVLPKLHHLKQENYELFLKYHGISMVLNLLILLLTFSKIGFIFLKG